MDKNKKLQAQIDFLEACGLKLNEEIKNNSDLVQKIFDSYNKSQQGGKYEENIELKVRKLGKNIRDTFLDVSKTTKGAIEYVKNELNRSTNNPIENMLNGFYSLLFSKIKDGTDCKQTVSYIKSYINLFLNSLEIGNGEYNNLYLPYREIYGIKRELNQIVLEIDENYNSLDLFFIYKKLVNLFTEFTINYLNIDKKFDIYKILENKDFFRKVFSFSCFLINSSYEKLSKMGISKENFFNEIIKITKESFSEKDMKQTFEWLLYCIDREISEIKIKENGFYYSSEKDSAKHLDSVKTILDISEIVGEYLINFAKYGNDKLKSEFSYNKINPFNLESLDSDEGLGEIPESSDGSMTDAPKEENSDNYGDVSLDS